MRPAATTATGVLQGSKIQLPKVLPFPVSIDKLSLEAKETVLLIKSATVSSGESRVDVSGTVTYLHDKFAIDADVKGDQVIIPELPPQSKTEASAKRAAESKPTEGEKQRELLKKLWDMPASGTVRVDIGRAPLPDTA
jgi:hypothetical protein